jgi:hypothetical protein
VPQSAARPKLPGTLIVVTVLMVVQGTCWLVAFLIMLSEVDFTFVGLRMLVPTLGALGMTVWTFVASFGFRPGRSTARTAALTVTLLTIPPDLALSLEGLETIQNSTGAYSTGNAIVIGGMLVIPLIVSTATALLLFSRSAKDYLTGPQHS